jgi:hypothetical protein
MASLERRVRLLEAWSLPAKCLECEMRRINASVAGDSEPAQPCTHRRGLGLLEALIGLNGMETRHANA